MVKSEYKSLQANEEEYKTIDELYMSPTPPKKYVILLRRQEIILLPLPLAATEITLVLPDKTTFLKCIYKCYIYLIHFCLVELRYSLFNGLGFQLPQRTDILDLIEYLSFNHLAFDSIRCYLHIQLIESKEVSFYCLHVLLLFLLYFI